MHRYHNLGSVEDNVIADLPDEELDAKISNLSTGCFIIMFEVGDKEGNLEPITMYKFHKNLSTMISKENLFSLHMRFLNSEERAKCADIYAATKNPQNM